MKRLFTGLLIIFLAILCGCGTNNTQMIEQAKSIQILNDTIDSDITNLVSLYRNSNTSLNEIKSSSDTITTIDDNIRELKGKLTSFNDEYDDKLEFDSKMFEQYEEIISDLEEWKDELIDNYGDDSDLAGSYRISLNSNQAIIISDRQKVIEMYKPDYQSIIE